MKISKILQNNIDYIEKQTGCCFDISKRTFFTAKGKKTAVFYVDGLVNKDIINQDIIKPLLEIRYASRTPDIKDIGDILKDVLSASDVRRIFDCDTAIEKLLSGDTILFMEGETSCLVMQTRGWQSRGIDKPRTQNSVRGPAEAFTETLLFNTAMLRRKIRSEKLRFENMQIGKNTKTDVAIAYIDGIAKREVVAKVRKRLKAIKAEYILESGHIEQLIEDNPSSLFSTVGNNEKPDIVAAKLLKGRVAIFVDGCPFVLTVPMVFSENFHSAEDYYSRPYFSTLIRILRTISYIVTLFFPGLYIALVNFHREMIPQKLLYTIMAAKDGIPFPSFLELLFMLALYEIIREAVLRLPTPVGSTVGIVGGLIIGDAAVSAGIVGGPVVVVAAVTFICSAVVNPLMDSTSILRIIMLVLGAIMGIFGILAGVFALCLHLCTLKSFGAPYMMPFSPLSKRGLKDSVIRMPIREIIWEEDKN